MSIEFKSVAKIAAAALMAVSLSLAGGCAVDPPTHSPWPTLPEGGSSTKTAVEGGKGTVSAGGSSSDAGSGKSPQVKDAGGSSEN